MLYICKCKQAHFILTTAIEGGHAYHAHCTERGPETKRGNWPKVTKLVSDSTGI